MTAAPYPATCAAVIARFEDSRRAIDTLLATATPDLIAAAGTVQDWSLKDHLMHLVVWLEGITALLRYQSRPAAMGLRRSFFTDPAVTVDEMNAEIYERYRALPLPAALAAFAAASQAFVATLHTLADADLLKPYRHYQPDEPYEPDEDCAAPVIRWIDDNSYGHYEEHWPWMAARLARDVARPGG